jgi:DNA polymerase-3 subunit gamma/tau
LKSVDSKEQIQVNNLKNAVFETFNYDQVKMAWRRYAFDVKEKGKETFYNAMVKREPKIKEETTLIMEVDNQIQIDYITPHLNDLISFLRQELKNYDISVEFLLIEDNDSTVKFLSGKDRFAAMARKNANLHTLKKVFNLDIEF